MVAEIIARYRSAMMRVQRWTAPKRMQIIHAFVVAEVLFSLTTVVLGLFVPTNIRLFVLLFAVGKKLGVLSAGMLCLTLVPGIIRRFGILPELRVFLMMFRRHFGILTYLFAVAHSLLTYWLPALRFGFTPILTFQLLGMIALGFGTPLFITSNDFSVRVLQKWWDHVHSLVYLMLFFAALHTLFTSPTTGILLMAVVVLEVISYLVQYSHGHTVPRG